jgi:hypothetical protein
MGITLVTVPFWWDRLPNSLASTIQLQRPDIHFPQITVPALPISLEMPLQYQNKFSYKANIAKEFNNQVDPTGW